MTCRSNWAYNQLHYYQTGIKSWSKSIWHIFLGRSKACICGEETW